MYRRRCHIYTSVVRILAVFIVLLAATGCHDAIVHDRPPAVVDYGYPPAPHNRPSRVEASLAAQELEPLVSPIALYPDALLAVMLPAATYPNAIRDASKWLSANPSPSDDAIHAQAWPAEVKALLHYPDVLAYMSNDPQFTESLGAAYDSQPADVTCAIQDLRTQAVKAGSLQTNSQQVVLQEAGVVAIHPRTPQVIFIPTYDPVTIYAAGFTQIIYGPSFAVGPWLVNGYDWARGGAFVGDWRGPYYYEGEIGWLKWHWGYDKKWDHPERWRHDERFEPSPHMPPYAYHNARGVAGRERTLRQHAFEHAEGVHKENMQMMAPRYSPATPVRIPAAKPIGDGRPVGPRVDDPKKLSVDDPKNIKDKKNVLPD